MADSYYADTSAIRAAGGSFASMLESNRLRTSVLTAIELLHGVTKSEDEFRRRRAGLRTLNGWIDGRMPEQVIFSSFPALSVEFNFIEKRLGSLANILKALDQTDTLADFGHALAAATPEFSLDYFASYDQRFESIFGRCTEAGAQEARRLFEGHDASNVDPIGMIPSEVLAGSFADFCHWLLTDAISLNEYLVKMGLAAEATNLAIESPSNELIYRVCNSYNGIGYNFLKVLTVKLTTQESTNQDCHRNDGMDVAHFLYLCEGEVLVSEDSAQRELAARIGVRAITLNELRDVLF